MDSLRANGRIGGPRPIAGGASVAARDADRKPESSRRAAPPSDEAARGADGRATAVELSAQARLLAVHGGSGEPATGHRGTGGEGPRRPIPPALRASYVQRFATAQTGTTGGRLIDTRA